MVRGVYLTDLEMELTANLVCLSSKCSELNL